MITINEMDNIITIDLGKEIHYLPFKDSDLKREEKIVYALANVLGVADIVDVNYKKDLLQ